MIEVMNEMADLVRAAVAGNGVDVQVEPRRVLNPTPPTVDIYVGDPAKGFDAAGFGDMAGEDIYTVRLRVGITDYEENHELLYDFMDEESPLCVPMAILQEDTLNGLVNSIDITSFSGELLFPNLEGTMVHIGCQWGFQVIPARS